MNYLLLPVKRSDDFDETNEVLVEGRELIGRYPQFAMVRATDHPFFVAGYERRIDGEASYVTNVAGGLVFRIPITGDSKVVETGVSANPRHSTVKVVAP